jgi:hypothetical protein
VNVVIGLLVIVALATVVKLGVRRMFRGAGYAQREAEERAAAEAKTKPRAKTTPRRAPGHSGRTTPKGQRRR